MRAYATDRLGDLSRLTLRELPKPSPGARELLIQVKAAALNPADLKVVTRTGFGPFLHSTRVPLIPGYDFSGTIVEVGSGAGTRTVGEDVFGFLPYSPGTRGGTLAEYVAVRAATVSPKPGKLSHEEAASAATAGVTALQALRDKGRLVSGQSVLINGASGGVGTFAVQIARIMGANVTAVCGAAKAELVRSLGASRVYDYKVTRLPQITERFDVVLDAACTSSFGECAPLLKPGGTYIVLLPSARFAGGMLMSLFTSKRSRFLPVSPEPKDFARLAAWFDDGTLKSVVDTAYPLAELPKALARLQSGDVRGKVAITI